MAIPKPDSYPGESEGAKPREVRLPRRKGGGYYVLRMRDYSQRFVPDALGVWEQVAPALDAGGKPAPVPVTGLVELPARFTVKVPGSSALIELVLDRVPRNKTGTRSDLAFTEVHVVGELRPPLPAEAHVKHYVPRRAVEEWPRLPLEALLREAVKLAGVVGLCYPPGYSGPRFTDLGATVKRSTIEVPADSPHGLAFFVGWADSANRIVRELSTARRPPRVNSDSPERLRLVARAYKQAAPGRTREAVLEALREAEGFEHSPDNAKRLIAKCRAKGLIPPSNKGRE